ncbi:hypothetical protein [Streptomyces axinellae]|uniref:Transcriptional regulator n=1 Tax=Streptomyces axinellae TaxID=552788 RepID=A0ABP6C8B8_9ACTN
MRPSDPTHAPAHAAGRARTRPPNRALRALLEETEWTQAAFAHAITRLGVEIGIHLRYDRTSVAHWLRGSRPDPRVQHLMAEALSRRLGRRVTVSELGMRSTQGARGARAGAGARRRRGADGDEEGPHAGSRNYATATLDALLPDPGGHTHPADRLTALTAPVVPPPRADAPPPAPYTLRLLEESVRHDRSRDSEQPRIRAQFDPEERRPARHERAATHEPPAAPEPSGHPAPSGLSTPSGGRMAHPGHRTPPATAPAPDPATLPATAPAAAARNTCSARGTRPSAPPGPGEVASVHEHARFFALQADRYGGGHIRTSLAAYLSGLVRPLRCGEESAAHRGMLAGGARLSYLLARVYADEQRHGLAQRAFLTAADLASEADDPEGVALARRALSSQAHQLGHPRASLALAEAACEGAPADADPSTRAFLYAGLAVAEAAGGDRTRALAALGRAERQLACAPADLTTGPASPGREPVGSYQDAALLYQSSQLHAALGDRTGAIRDLRSSLRARPSGERRSRALCQAELAELLLSCGRLEEACVSWQDFLAECAQVRSGRVLAARSRMPVLLRPYARERCVQALLARTRAPAAGRRYG